MLIMTFLITQGQSHVLKLNADRGATITTTAAPKREAGIRCLES